MEVRHDHAQFLRIQPHLAVNEEQMFGSMVLTGLGAEGVEIAVWNDVH